MYAKMRQIGDDFDNNLHYVGRWVKSGGLCAPPR